MNGIQVKKTVWGEIQNKPFYVSEQLSPDEDENNTTDKRDIQRETPLSNTTSLAKEDEYDFNYDPIGSRLIKLRHYYVYLNQKLRHRATRRRVTTSKSFLARRRVTTSKSFLARRRATTSKSFLARRSRRRRYKKKYCVPPAFPENYPFRGTLAKTSSNTPKMIKCSGEMSENTLESERKLFVKKVITQVGFIECEDEVVNYLSAIVDDYLRKFVTALSHKKNSEHFSEDEDLWNAFDATLRKFEILGITALHAFYFENVIRKHDFLEEACNDLYTQLQRFKRFKI